MQNSAGLRYSLIMHSILLALIVFGLPEFLQIQRPPEPMSMTDRVVEVSLISNVPNEQKSEAKPETKKPVEEQKTAIKPTQEAAKEPVKKPDAVPLPKEEKKPEVKKPEEKKPEEKKPEPKKVEKPKEKSLDEILKSVKETAKATESKKPTEAKTTSEHTSKSDRPFVEGMPLSMSETDAIRQQFQKCWDMPAGAKDAQNLASLLHIELLEDGTVTKVELKGNSSRYASDSFFRAAADSAIRAVKRCSPLKNLPSGKYDTWRVMELNFDPKDAL